MQISGKVLLNQAESIIRDRKGERQSVTGQTEKSNPEVASTVAGSFSSRILNLQASLAELQSQLSRQQARLSHIDENPAELNSQIQYEGQQLFSEQEVNSDPKTVGQEIQQTMQGLTEKLKTTEVEMENLYALGFTTPESFQFSAEQLASISSKDLDPQRVARLTRN